MSTVCRGARPVFTSYALMVAVFPTGPSDANFFFVFTLKK
jgi:hypothetical protein